MVFGSIKWFVQRSSQTKKVVTECEWRYGVFKTKPLQGTPCGCGIFLLYYMDDISSRIVEERPQPESRSGSFIAQIEQWAGGGFNRRQASVRRGSLHLRTLRLYIWFPWSLLWFNICNIY
ncbi:hypothetical protein PHMEG_00015489 [Phytophthora megakarya]|uniref:Uncharacterized protein n=1 Tax=Phytophthora megakarya TaxID=4795 RepID=A0A225W3P6_9STRA|nr:hypothetical protein PHMEG_00015489 [Phytophthora megakarya]